MSPSALERQVYSVARLCPDQNFLSLCHRRRVAGLSMLHKVNSNSNYCPVSSASFYLLLLEFDIPELPPQLIRWSLKYQGVECPNLLGFSCQHRFDCGMTFPTLCLTPKRSMGSRVQSSVGCFLELCFLQYFVAYVLVGLRKQFMNNFVLPTWACTAGFNNNTNNKVYAINTSTVHMLRCTQYV